MVLTENSGKEKKVLGPRGPIHHTWFFCKRWIEFLDGPQHSSLLRCQRWLRRHKEAAHDCMFAFATSGPKMFASSTPPALCIETWSCRRGPSIYHQYISPWQEITKPAGDLKFPAGCSRYPSQCKLNTAMRTAKSWQVFRRKREAMIKNDKSLGSSRVYSVHSLYDTSAALVAYAKGAWSIAMIKALIETKNGSPSHVLYMCYALFRYNIW